MNPRPFALAAGFILLIIGIAAFVPPLAPLETSPLRIAAGVGGPQLFGLFPVGPVLNGLHLVLGAWGLYAGQRLGRSVVFARWAAILLFLLVVMGVIPGLDEMFGGGPLYGNNLLLHGALALLAFLFGWLYRRPIEAADEELQADSAASVTARNGPAPRVAPAQRPAASGTTTSRK